MGLRIILNQSINDCPLERAGFLMGYWSLDVKLFADVGWVIFERLKTEVLPVRVGVLLDEAVGVDGVDDAELCF